MIQGTISYSKGSPRAPTVPSFLRRWLTVSPRSLLFPCIASLIKKCFRESLCSWAPWEGMVQESKWSQKTEFTNLINRYFKAAM